MAAVVPQAVTWVIALVALVVALATYRLNVRDKRRSWDEQRRSQAEQVAGWLTREMCDEHERMEWKAHVRNGSELPVYDFVYVIRHQELDAAMPEFIPMVLSEAERRRLKDEGSLFELERDRRTHGHGQPIKPTSE